MLTLSTILFGLWIILKDSKVVNNIIGLLFTLSLLILLGFSIYEVGFTTTLFLNLSIHFLFLALTGSILSWLMETKMIQWITFVGFCLLSIFPNKILDSADTKNEISYDTRGELIVQFKVEHQQYLIELSEKYDAKFIKAFHPIHSNTVSLEEYYMMDIPNYSANKLNSIISDLESSGKIIWIEPNEVIPFEFPEKDVSKIQKSNQVSNDPSVSLQWHLSFLGMDKYYEFFKSNKLIPTKRARLFILDTGIDSNHEDMNISGRNNPKDKQGHGTHCAGVAAAITNNQLGVASMSPGVEWIEVRAIQVIGDVGFGTQKEIIDGIIKAADEGADVISMSLGGITNQSREKAYNEAVRYANDLGAIVVAAAGNANLDAKRYSPANAQNIITVSSVNNQKRKSGFSNSLQNISMGLAAPGEKIFSTTPANTYTAFNGTSMATPQVAGIIAVMKALRPDLDTKTAFNILNQTGESLPDGDKTGKLIQPYEAIKKLLLEGNF